MKIIYKNIDFETNKNIDINSIDLRDEFDDILKDIPKNLEFYLSWISEKNTLRCDLYLDFLRVNLIKQYNDIVVYTNRVGIYKEFQNNVSFINKIKFEIKFLKEKTIAFLSILKFLSKYKIRKKRDMKDYILIQTWVNKNNFKNGFKDNYFGNLYDVLKQKHKVLNWVIPFRDKLPKLDKKMFIEMNEGVGVIDYFRVIKLFFKKKKIDYKNKLFNYYRDIEKINYTDLCYFFAKNLKPKKVILLNENMVYQKAVILAGIKTIGYFHTTKPRNILCLEDFSLRSDIVLFNSYVYKNYFKLKNSFNTIAFKQLYLKDNIKINDYILVLLSGKKEEAIFLLKLLDKLNIKNIVFRQHPLNRFDISKYYKNSYKLENNKPLTKIIGKKVISNYSAVAVEIATKGVFVGLVYDKNKLLLNPFDDTTLDNYMLISNIDELKEFIQKDTIITKTKQIFNIQQSCEKFLEVIK